MAAAELALSKAWWAGVLIMCTFVSELHASLRQPLSSFLVVPVLNAEPRASIALCVPQLPPSSVSAGNS